MILEELAQFRLGRELTGRDDHLGVAVAPVGQGGGDHVCEAVGGVFDESHAGAGEEALGLDRVGEKCRVLPELGGGDAGEAHLFLALGSDQGLDHLLPAKRDAHRVGPIDQQAGPGRVWLAEIGGGVAGGELHRASARSRMSCRIRSAMITIRRRLASRSAAMVATVVEVAA